MDTYSREAVLSILEMALAPDGSERKQFEFANLGRPSQVNIGSKV